MDEEEIKKDFSAKVHFHLLLDMNLLELKKGTINQFAKILETPCSPPTKYKFLKNIAKHGGLKENGSISWGERNLIEYKIDKDQLYEILIRTPIGKKMREVVKSGGRLFIDGFFR